VAKLIVRLGSPYDGMYPETKDRMVAPKISELIGPNVPDISSEKKTPINDFVSNHRLFFSQSNITRQCCFNLMQNAEAAFDEYCAARTALLEYLPVKSTTVAAYFAALRHFEHCLAHLYQAVESMNAIRKACGEEPEFQKNDGSPLQRINKLNNHVKHIAEIYRRVSIGDTKTFELFATQTDGSTKIPHDAKDSTNVPIWMTNVGLECREATLTYAELADEVLSTLNNAVTIANLGGK
jgi:hypothetical protein